MAGVDEGGHHDDHMLIAVGAYGDRMIAIVHDDHMMIAVGAYGDRMIVIVVGVDEGVAGMC